MAFLVGVFTFAPALIHGGLSGFGSIALLLAVVFLVVYVATVIPLARAERSGSRAANPQPEPRRTPSTPERG